MKNTIIALFTGAAILIAGCSRQPKSDLTALQGTWNGRQIHANPKIPDHPCALVISGNSYEFKDDADTNAWNKGNFTLREDTDPRQFIAVVGEAHLAPFVGATVMAIYRVENDTLLVTWNAPGKADAPSAFDARGAARTEFKRN